MGIQRALRATVSILLAVALAACGSTGTPAGDELPEPANTPSSPVPTFELTVCEPPPFLDQPAVAVPQDLQQQVSRWVDSVPGHAAGYWWDNRGEQFVVVAVDPAAAAAALTEGLGIAPGDDAPVRVEPGVRNATALTAIQDRVSELAAYGLTPSSSRRVWDGTVAIGLEFLDDTSLAAVREVFTDDLDAICVTGADPDAVPPDGPQPTEGDGWRLLQDEMVGEPYGVDVVVAQVEYEALWNASGLTGSPPDVDFGEEIVIQFVAAYSGSCPEIRLDDVVVDRSGGTVTADIVLLGGNRYCTADANPRSYVVAVLRDRLPDVPFTVSPYPDCEWCQVASVDDLDSDGDADGDADDAATTSGDLSGQDLADVLAAIAVHRVTVDNSFGGGSPFERIDVIETVGVTGADGFVDARDGRPLADAERAAIAGALAPLPVQFVPATVFDDLDPADDPGGRAIVTLAEPAEVDGQLIVASQLWCGGLCGIGGAHELRRDDGTWTIGEPVGPQWIS